jgi:Zn-dependent metalloprotease
MAINRIYMNRIFLFSLLVLLGFKPLFAQKDANGKPIKVLGKRMPTSFNPATNKESIRFEPNGVVKKLDNITGIQTKSVSYFLLPKTSALPKTALDANQKVSLALEEVKEDLGLKSLEGSFKIKSVEKDELGMSHIRFNQQFGGIEVWGAEMILHERNGLQFMNGKFLAEPSLSFVAKLKKEDALLICQNYLAQKTEVRNLTAQELALTQYAGPRVEPILYPINNKIVLAYFIEMKPNLLSTWRCFIDAQTGEVLNSYNQACTVDGPKTATSTDLNGISRTINTYEKSGTTFMIDASRSMYNAGASKMPDDPIGAIWTIDAQNTYVQSVVQISSSTNSNWPSKGVSAHYNGGIAFEYYKNTHSRNSINGNGGTIISVINVSEQNGQGMDNAFWTGELMCYGNGKVAFKPLAGSLDVAGHEMTHGVVQNTANLEYQGQSGAMNESMADIFACMMDRDDWLLGEDVVKTQYFPTGALRNLSDPHNGGSSLNDNGYQPRTMGEYYSGTQDNGGVHINSGIPNWAFYKFATAVGKDKAELVYYRALSKYLSKTSQFVDLRIAVVQSCIDLYGDGGAEYNAAKSAFNEVGIYATDPGGGGGGTGGGGTNTAIDLQVNPGQDYILSYDDSFIDPVTLYQSSTTATNYKAQSSRSMNRRPSVTDDGSFGIFVGTDNKIYKLNLGSNPSETLLFGDAIWDNAVVSKDGKRIAAITTSIDSAIYVYDFDRQYWQEFKLYNPTYSAGINTGSVLYADALEFDYTGEKIVYDARNVISNPGGTDLDFWDIGMIEVWSNAKSTYGSGKIEKLYTQLPQDVSIGNPTFSKNSPYILAFDYIDNVNNKFAVIGKNINSNVDDIIVVNDQISYPNYSKYDDALIYDVVTTTNQKWIAKVSLEANKIKGKNDAAVLIPDAYWGTWYSTGKRNLMSNKKEITAFSFPGLTPPVEGLIDGTNIYVNILTTSTTDFTELVASFTSSAFSVVTVDTTPQISGVTKNNFTNSPTIPIQYKVRAQDGSEITYYIKVNSVNGVLENSLESINVFPNPSHESLHIELKGDFSYSVFDLQGKKLLSGNGSDGVVVNSNEIESGYYILEIATDKARTTRKILVQH